MPPRLSSETATTAVAGSTELPISLEIRRLTRERDASRAACAAAAAGGDCTLDFGAAEQDRAAGSAPQAEATRRAPPEEPPA
eukprot:2759830-Pleurochrysis_carterae.AAC.1